MRYSSLTTLSAKALMSILQIRMFEPYRIWVFNAFEIDERRREVRLAGDLVEIEGRPFDVLMVLLRADGQLVRKKDLIDRVWQGRIVTDGVLASAIKKLRMALGACQHLVVTLHGQGYRFAGSVRWQQLPSDAEDARFELIVGRPIPQRKRFLLDRALRLGDAGCAVWVARHVQSGKYRVFKFAVSERQHAQLRHEVAAFILAQHRLKDSPHLVGVLDWRLDGPVQWIESEWIRPGDMVTWSAARGGLQTIAQEDRLRLATTLMTVISQFHQLGVIHADLKPSNVFVADDEGCVLKLGDLGANRPLSRAEVQNLSASLKIQAGIPAECTLSSAWYCAPERLVGADATMQTDVYACGVLLYQLAVGDFNAVLGAGWEEQIDCGRLRQDIADACHVNAAHRLGSIHELLMRVASLPQRREEAAATERVIAQLREAVRISKRTRRQRRFFSALAAVFSLGALVAGYAAWRAIRAEQSLRLEVQRVEIASSEALRHSQRAEQLNRFLIEDVLLARPLSGTGRAATLLDILRQADANLDRRFANDPEAAALMRVTIASSFDRLGERELVKSLTSQITAAHPAARLQALKLLLGTAESKAQGSIIREAEELTRQLPEHDEARLSFEQLRSYTEPASVALAQTRRLNELLDQSVSVSRSVSMEVRNAYASALFRNCRWSEAEVIMRTLLAEAESEGDVEIATYLKNSLAVVRAELGQFESSRALLEKVISRALASGSDYAAIHSATKNLAIVMMWQGLIAEALALLNASKAQASLPITRDKRYVIELDIVKAQILARSKQARSALAVLSPYLQAPDSLNLSARNTAILFSTAAAASLKLGKSKAATLYADKAVNLAQGIMVPADPVLLEAQVIRALLHAPHSTSQPPAEMAGLIRLVAGNYAAEHPRSIWLHRLASFPHSR